MSPLVIPQVPFTVEGRRFTLDQVDGGTFYHGTIHELPVGGELRPSSATGIEPNFTQSDLNRVSVTSYESSAWEWAVNAAKRAGLDRDAAKVYKVHPMGELVIWGTTLANFGKSFRVMEIRADYALVTEEVFRSS